MPKKSCKLLKRMLCSSKIPRVHRSTNEVKQLDSHGVNDIITYEFLTGGASNKRKYFKKYFKAILNYDADYYKNVVIHNNMVVDRDTIWNADIHRKNAIRDPKKKPLVYRLVPAKIIYPELPELTHGIVWKWRENEYDIGHEVLTEDIEIEKDVIIPPSELYNDAVKYNYVDELYDLMLRLPSPTVLKSKPIIKKLFKIIVGDLDLFRQHFRLYQDDKWKYDDTKPFHRAVNPLKYDGIGESEILIVIEVQGATLQGGGTAYDIAIDNPVYKKLWEIKSDVSSKGSFRLGKSSVASNEVYDNE